MRHLVVTATAAALLAISGIASADSPWVLQAGVGLGVHRTHADYPDAPPAGLSFGPAVQIDAGYRVHCIAAVGFHLGAQVVSAPQEQSATSFTDQTYIGVEAGVSGSIVLDRVSLSPWLGLQSLHNKRYRAAGHRSSACRRDSARQAFANGFQSPRRRSRTQPSTKPMTAQALRALVEVHLDQK
jgi:hypothetical protein